MVGLTTVLQSELEKLESPIQLFTSQGTNLKMNFDGWAHAQSNERSIDACRFLDSDLMQLQLIDREILAGQIATTDLTIIASIIDLWLSEVQTGEQIKHAYSEFQLSEKYSDLLTFSIDELLEKTWESEYKRIASREIHFNPDLFLALKAKLPFLFPLFSHDNLWFSNILELPNHNFKSPIIFSKNGTFEIGLKLSNSESNDLFKTTNIQEAVKKTIELLPSSFDRTKNPLRN
jgi:hypothetical protein